MFDGLQVVEIPVQNSRKAVTAKANQRARELALLMLMAATMCLSTLALLGVMVVSA